MRYELIMLRNALRMKRTANILTKEMKLIALRSYSTINWRDGTMGQIRAMNHTSQQIGDCLEFYNSVEKALLIVPSGYRALLVSVYLKNVDKQQISTKYHVSVSTVYRKLLRARESFLRALNSIGCSEQWFTERYGDYNWDERLPYHKCS